jgi:AcrR family transcriptional regulator
MSDPTPKKKRIRNPELTREKLLQTAITIMANNGEQALSLTDVVKKSGISRSAAYLHFSDREHLLTEAKNWIKQRLQHAVDTFDDSTPLYDRILLTSKLVLQNPDAAKIMLMDSLTADDPGLIDPLYQAVQRKMQHSLDRGEVNTRLDPEISSFIHLGSLYSTLLLARHHHGELVDVDELAHRYTTEWCQYLQGAFFEANSVRGETPIPN